MDWVSFMTGVVSVGLVYALIASGLEADDLEVDSEETDSELIVNDNTTRNVMMSCQTCRKLKKHREVERDLYQCVKCKRHVDLRRAS